MLESFFKLSEHKTNVRTELVAGLTQRMFDEEGPAILVQILHQPMLDSDATPSRREFQRTPGASTARR